MTDFNINLLMPLAPEMFMALAGLLLLVVGVFRGDRGAAVVGQASALVAAIACFLVIQSDWTRVEILNGMFVMDAFAGVVKLFILGGIVVSILLSVRFLEEEGMARFEYPILILFSGVGMMLMVSAHDLLALYVGFELQSLALYVLAAIRRDNLKSSEAGLKYFILGALSSGMLLFGASLIYGFSGSTNFAAIGDALAQGPNAGALIGMAFLIAGIAFKISAAPFHMWTPDVYEGAPTSVTAFFAMVPKLASMAMLMRLLFEAFPSAAEQWQQIVWVLSALSMTVGAFAALLQDNIKRLLAYSSIGNMGFALVGLAAGTAEGVSSVIVYMIIYMVMTAGTFGVILSMRRQGRALEQISDLAGLSRNHPMQALALAVMMFSMSGIPPLAGFFSKLLVFKAAISAGLYGLAIFGVLTSVVGAYYYLRIVKVMFFDEPAAKYDGGIPFFRHAIVAVSVLFVIAFIFAPSAFLTLGQNAAQSIVNG